MGRKSFWSSTKKRSRSMPGPAMFITIPNEGSFDGNGPLQLGGNPESRDEDHPDPREFRGGALRLSLPGFGSAENQRRRCGGPAFRPGARPILHEWEKRLGSDLA